ncbi:hypothetical protein HY091_01510 [Candidatus Kaiserbacteria bacterium]|nr:hypothetical protein [Candidatus Kaiserbacteria bacterium]
MITDLSPEEAGRWMDAAPTPVQTVVSDPATPQLVYQIGDRYGLHVDTIGILVKLTGYMLLGYVSPAQFLQELVAAGVPDAQARQIMDEINKKIFVSVREEMRRAVGKPAAPPAPRVVAGATRANAPVPSYVSSKPPPAQPTPHMQRPAIQSAPPAARPALSGAPLPPKVVLPGRPGELDLPVGEGSSPAVAFPPQPTQPAREEQKSGRPQGGDPRTFAMRAPVAATAPPPPNLPGAMPTSVPPGVIAPGAHFTPPSPMRPAQPPPVSTTSPPSPPAPAAPRTYSSDPYREPIE